MQIIANNTTLEYAEYGPPDGPPMVLIRGLGSQLIHWPTEFVQGFANRGYRTIIFDNRDIGLSQRFGAPDTTGDADEILGAIAAGNRPKAAYTLDDMALDVAGLLDALKISKAHVLGISMGGMIAQLLAMKFAARLISATLVMTTAGVRDPGLLAQGLIRDEDRGAFQDSWVAGHKSWGSPGYPMTEADIRTEAGRAWDRGNSADGVNRQAIATILAADRRAALKCVDLACLVIHGAVDTVIPPAAGREIAALIPGARLEIIQGMGHVITPAVSDLINDMVDGFIRESGLR